MFTTATSFAVNTALRFKKSLEMTDGRAFSDLLGQACYRANRVLAH